MNDSRSAWREILETVLLTLAIYGLLSMGFRNFRVEGDSMEPNFHDGQYLVVNRLSYRLHSPERGDVVIFHAPPNPDKDYIKRLIGLPGEVVEIREGRVLISGQPLEEPYIAFPPTTSWGPQTVGPNEYLVLGDNRTNSSDSRSWGMLPQVNLIGKAWLSYWPPDDWGMVPHYSFATGN